MPKATEAFRNIGEVSADLGIRKHVLRFWEAKFPQLKPMKRGGGRRYYRPGDVLLLRGIQHLLQTSGYTIKGVQKILREEGVEDVKRIGSEREAARGVPAGGRPMHAPASEGTKQLTQPDISALRAIAAELETVRAMLSGGAIQQAQEPVRRSRRASAR